MENTTYYNALVYTDYGTIIPYHEITKPEAFLKYIQTNISWTKAFLYQKQQRRDKKGFYVAYSFPNMGTWSFRR